MVLVQRLPKVEVEEITYYWEKIVNKPVSIFEKKRFLETYVKTRSNVVLMTERILDISEDPYLFERAKSINWLFKGYYSAKKNKADIEQIGKNALNSVSSKQELETIESQLGGLAKKNCRNSIDSSDAIVRSLFEEDVNKARRRLDEKPRPSLPQDPGELLEAIKKQLERDDLTATQKSRFGDLVKIIPHCAFVTLIDLYSRRMEELS